VKGLKLRTPGLLAGHCCHKNEVTGSWLQYTLCAVHRQNCHYLEWNLNLVQASAVVGQVRYLSTRAENCPQSIAQRVLRNN
jgi:hypothetical protein